MPSSYNKTRPLSSGSRRKQDRKKKGRRNLLFSNTCTEGEAERAQSSASETLFSRFECWQHQTHRPGPSGLCFRLSPSIGVTQNINGKKFDKRETNIACDVIVCYFRATRNGMQFLDFRSRNKLS